MRIVTLEEAFSFPPVRLANHGHPTEGMYDLLVRAGYWPTGDSFPPGIDDIGDGRLADMDAAGVDYQVLSHTVPATEGLEPDLAVHLAGQVNDTLGSAVASHPDRFGAFATLPAGDPRKAAAELYRAVTTLKLCGALINGHVNGRYLDDRYFWPIFEAAESLSVPVYIHPSRPPQQVMDACYSGFTPLVNEILGTGAWGWHVDTGLHALRLIIAGVFDRFPDLQIILGHMGELLPSMMWRVEHALGPVLNLSRPIGEYFSSNFHFTTSAFFDFAPFVAALHAIGTDRIMFSIDYPYSRQKDGVAFLNSLPISLRDKHKIAHENAERLLKLPPISHAEKREE